MLRCEPSGPAPTSITAVTTKNCVVVMQPTDSMLLIRPCFVLESLLHPSEITTEYLETERSATAPPDGDRSSERRR